MLGALLVLLLLDDQIDRVGLTGLLSGDVSQQGVKGAAALPPGLLMAVVIASLVAISAREVCGIIRSKGIRISGLLTGTGAVGMCGLIYLVPDGSGAQGWAALFASLTVGVFAVSLLMHSRGGRAEGAIAAGGVAVLTLAYLGVLPGFLIMIRRSHGPWVVAAVVMITKVCDIGAYSVGRVWGRHKLIEWLSPGKTWEGLVGGVAAAGVVSGAMVAVANTYGLTGWWVVQGGERVYEHHVYPLWVAAACGVLIGVVGQLGDLTVSLFKRDAGIKDSGHAVPGFGGLLDVFDSPLMVAPVAYWLLQVGTIMS